MFSMQIKLDLLSPTIVSALENKELRIRFRAYGKSAASAQTDGDAYWRDGPLYTGF